MGAAQHAPGGRFQILERLHGLAEIFQRGVVVHVERACVIRPHLERELMSLTKNASRHGRRFTRQCLGFFEAPQIEKGRRVADRFSNGFSMFFTSELQSAQVYISLQR